VKKYLSKTQRLVVFLLFLAAWAVKASATEDTRIITGVVSFPPQIDATNVINKSVNFNIGTSQPFDTSNTRNFTNEGSMVGSVGFRFDTAPRNNSGSLIAPRRLSSNFHNRNGGSISAQDGFFQNFVSFVNGSYLLVQSTNIVNQGLLSVGGGGLLQVTGTNVNLSRSGLGVNSITGTGSANGDTNFVPDVAIYDRYWGQTNATYNTADIITSQGGFLNVVSPPHRVSNLGASGTVQLSLFDPYSAAYTNVVGGVFLSVTNSSGDVEDIFFPTNIIRQAAFVGASAANFGVDIRFFPSSSPTNLMQTVAIELVVGNTNVITSQTEFNTIYFVDTMAAETNRGLLLNVNDGTFKPANYLVSRQPVAEFFFGGPGNDVVTDTFLYDTDFKARVVDGEYAGYRAFVDNLASRPPNIPAGTVTNLPGRLEIRADSLDLTKTRMRAEGLLTINARHLAGSSNAVVDAENISFNLGSTNGSLRIQNLLNESVARMKGDLFAWTGLWTNAFDIIIPNYSVDTNGATLAPLTNTVQMTLHALMLDATALLDLVPVTIYDLKTHGTNVLISTNDHGVVAQYFLVDGDSFTLDGSLTLTGSADHWIYTNAPTLKYFTNNGSLTIANEAHFGEDGPNHYSAFVNRGTISSFGQNIKSDYSELSGNNLSTGSFELTTGAGKMEAGGIDVVGDVSIRANTLKFNGASVTSQSRIYMTVTNALFDNGGTSANTFSCRDGFWLTVKPTGGDLLGTTLRTIAPSFASVSHLWSGLNYGASQAGFVNNVALGQLTPVMEGFDPYFVFSGTGADNGLYVDFLNLSQLTDYANQIQIDPNLTIYFAAASLGFTPPSTNGVPQQPEEYLDGQFGGRLRWVKDFAGPNSSVAVVSNGVSILVNRAKRNSLILDSDNDGIPNGLDFFPFDNVLVARLAVAAQLPLSTALSWNATAQKIYSVQATTNFISPNWETVLYYTNTATTNGNVTIEIPVPPGALRRFYRVGTTVP
jgi:hypothetical protein